MIKIRKSSVILLALFVVMCLSACGQSSSSDMDAEAGPAQEDYLSEEYEEEYEEDVEESESEFSMYDVEAFNALPYSDGVAWIQYGNSDNPTTAAVDIDGKVLFTMDETIYYLSPFSDGHAYYVTSDDDGVYEVVVDTFGNVTWTPDRESNEHIVAIGNGILIVERHTTGFESDYMEVGTCDTDGNMIQEYAHEIGGVTYDEANHLEARGTVIDTYRKVQTGYDMYQRVGCYMGDGLYCLANSMLFNPEAGMLYYHDGLDSWPEYTSNGQFRTTHSTYGPEIPVATLYDTSMNMLQSDPYYYYERTGQEAYGLEWAERDYDSDCTSYQDGLFYKNHCYWNDDNDITLHIAGYEDREMQGGPFYGDEAVLWVEGADGKKYVTVIDKEGNFQFDPIQINDSYFTIWNGYFLAKDSNDSWNIYNTQGNLLHSITDDIIPYLETGFVECSDISEGYTTVSYNGKNRMILYSIENAVNDQVRIPTENYSDEGEADSNEYTYISGFSIEGKWKSIGDYGFGQAQPGAIVVFDGANCNFFSPQDTYAFYSEGDWYRLDVTSFSSTGTESFTVKTIDDNHIDVIGGGGYITELERVE